MKKSRIKNFPQIIKSVKFTLSTIWKLSPKYMICKLSVTIIKGIIPADRTAQHRAARFDVVKETYHFGNKLYLVLTE